ncbi:MAG: VCBS repeat-containing protein [Candidatus Eisenbacteria bacterium]|nr:VCBS repeat-containing protein [Candidatus Eisenbacteria bacterium]MCC7144018.1 VCBS repeat-containing protein [Candidatus Eisenbacteria bacterium]
MSDRTVKNHLRIVHLAAALSFSTFQHSVAVGGTSPLVTPNAAGVEVVPGEWAGDPVRGAPWIPSRGAETKQYPYLPGWPNIEEILIFDPYGIVLSDLDGDQTQEVIAGSTDGKLYVWRPDGTTLPGWPVDLGTYIQSKVAVADLDLDGDREVIVACRNGIVAAYRLEGTLMPGWPKTVGQGYGTIAPNIYDLDADGVPEILWSARTKLHAWRASGSVVPGFPITISEQITGTLAIADVAEGEAPEIFAVTLQGSLFAFRANGTTLPGWPVHFGWETSWAAPSIGPLLDNGRKQILVVGSNGTAGTNIFGYEADGTPLANFPINYPSLQTYSCPVLANVDADKQLEIFNGGKVDGPSFWAWNHDGSLLDGFPQNAAPFLEGSTVVANLDRDPALEVMIADNFNPGKIFAYNADGSEVLYYPILKPHSCGPSSPSLGDVDNDGYMDIAMTMSSGWFGVWRTTTRWRPETAEWPTMFHDNWNTNQYGFREPTPGGGAMSKWPAAPLVDISDLRPEPWLVVGRHTVDGASLSLRLDQRSAVRARVVGVDGRIVRQLGSWIAKAGETEIAWDHRDAVGREVQAGVYFVQVEAQGSSASARIVVMR